jgi:hypothetical protein
VTLRWPTSGSHHLTSFSGKNAAPESHQASWLTSDARPTRTGEHVLDKSRVVPPVARINAQSEACIGVTGQSREGRRRELEVGREHRSEGVPERVHREAPLRVVERTAQVPLRDGLAVGGGDHEVVRVGMWRALLLTAEVTLCTQTRLLCCLQIFHYFRSHCICHSLLRTAYPSALTSTPNRRLLFASSPSGRGSNLLISEVIDPVALTLDLAPDAHPHLQREGRLRLVDELASLCSSLKRLSSASLLGRLALAKFRWLRSVLPKSRIRGVEGHAHEAGVLVCQEAGQARRHNRLLGGDVAPPKVPASGRCAHYKHVPWPSGWGVFEDQVAKHVEVTNANLTFGWARIQDVKLGDRPARRFAEGSGWGTFCQYGLTQSLPA